MREITQADVKSFLNNFATSREAQEGELERIFDYFHQIKHKSNFHKLMEDFLEEQNLELLKENYITTKETCIYNYEHKIQHNEECQFKVGAECDNKYQWKIQVVNSIDEEYDFLGIDANVIAECINNKLALFYEIFVKYSQILNLNIDIHPILNYLEEECHVFGRIYTDNDLPISEANIILEGDKTFNSGENKAQLLNLNHIKNLFFFPGQIIGIKGKREMDQFSIKYSVNNIYAGLPVHVNVKLDIDLILKHFNKEEIKNDIHIDEELLLNEGIENAVTNANVLKLYNNDNIHIMIINGYIYSDHEYSDNLNNSLKIVNEKCPHIVLIFGPFLYIANFSETLQKIGDVNVIYENAFKDIIKVAKNEHLEKTQFFIIPSVFDSINIYPLPQPPFCYLYEEVPNVHFVSNPCIIYVNELKIALTSCDIVFNLTKNVLCKPPEKKMFYLLEQILRQLSFFPSYPSEFTIDVTKFNNLLFNPNKLPDIFLFPSWTGGKSFITEIHKKLFICPFSINLPKAQPCNFLSNLYILPPNENKELSKRIVLENVFITRKE